MINVFDVKTILRNCLCPLFWRYFPKFWRGFTVEIYSVSSTSSENVLEDRKEYRAFKKALDFWKRWFMTAVARRK